MSNKKLNRCFLLILLLTICISLSISPSSAAYSIRLEEFRWKKNNLNVLVEMNNASTFEYAIAVHKALDSWTECISIYINSFNDRVLETLTFGFYIETINYTSSYDIYITFTPDEIPEGSGAIGVTNYSYNLLTHEPIPPINITITTFSATASSLLIQNIAMHELGHAIGLGHASPEKTDDGEPELMYYRTVQDVAIYPSTLDVYGLTMLYRDNYNKPVQLPQNIPYKMLLDDNVTPTPFPLPSPVPTLTPTPTTTSTTTPTPTLTPTPQPTTTPMNSPTATPKPTPLPTSTTILIQIPLIPFNYQTLIILTTVALAVVGLLLVLFTQGQTNRSSVLS